MPDHVEQATAAPGEVRESKPPPPPPELVAAVAAYLNWDEESTERMLRLKAAMWGER
jgi:hypothetical protein